jgi:hypothetical protein
MHFDVPFPGPNDPTDRAQYWQLKSEELRRHTGNSEADLSDDTDVLADEPVASTHEGNAEPCGHGGRSPDFNGPRVAASTKTNLIKRFTMSRKWMTRYYVPLWLGVIVVSLDVMDDISTTRSSELGSRQSASSLVAPS